MITSIAKQLTETLTDTLFDGWLTDDGFNFNENGDFCYGYFDGSKIGPDGEIHSIKII
jgi:hypothetical protein